MDRQGQKTKTDKSKFDAQFYLGKYTYIYENFIKNKLKFIKHIKTYMHIY